MDWIIQSSFSMQSYGKQLSLFYDQYQSFIPPNPSVQKWKKICEYTQADTLLEWGPNEHFLEYQILQKTLWLIHPTQSHSIPPNPTIDVLMLKLIAFIFGTETIMSQKNCQGWMVGPVLELLPLAVVSGGQVQIRWAGLAWHWEYQIKRDSKWVHPHLDYP